MKTSHRLAPALPVLMLALQAIAGAEVIEQILVKVNGEIFTKTELEARQVVALRQSGMQLDPATDPTGAELRRALEEITPQLMVSVVDEMLIVQRGRDLGYRLTDDRFQAYLENIKKDSNLTTEEQFEAALKQENLTLPELRRNIERQMIVSQVQQNEVGGIAVTEEEARRYYESNRHEFTTAPTVMVREIFVAVPGDGQTINVGQDEAIRDKAAGIRARAVAGESFDQLAAELSEAPSRANAGLIGPLALNDLSPDLRTRLEAMKAGEISELLRTPRGYQILKLESITPAETMPFDQARQEISDRVFTGKRREHFERFLERLRGEAIIEWKNPELLKAYELGLQQQRAVTAG